ARVAREHEPAVERGEQLAALTRAKLAQRAGCLGERLRLRRTCLTVVAAAPAQALELLAEVRELQFHRAGAGDGEHAVRRQGADGADKPPSCATPAGAPLPGKSVQPCDLGDQPRLAGVLEGLREQTSDELEISLELAEVRRGRELDVLRGDRHACALLH